MQTSIEVTKTSINIDSKLWKEAKIYAIRQGITISELIEKLLRDELKKSKKEA